MLFTKEILSSVFYLFTNNYGEINNLSSISRKKIEKFGKFG